MSLREGLTIASLSPAIARAVARAEHAARLGALFVDLPYFASFVEELVRYTFGLTPRANEWGDITHERAVPFLHALVRRVARADADATTRDEARAFTLGLASHLAIDQALHPLINWLADAEVARTGISHASAHREVEKFQSVCFQETYFGVDLMGTAPVRAHLHVAGLDRLERSAVAQVAILAMADAFGRSPSIGDVAKWGRSFVVFSKMVASPLGRRVAPPAAKEEARPRFLHGSWGSFESRLDVTIAASSRVLEAVGALIEGPPHELSLDDVRGALTGLLDAGTIDPPGSTFVA